MKWLKSTSNQTYTVEGKVIPSYDKAPLSVSDEVYAKIAKNTVIASLVKNGGIVVLDKYNNPDTKDASTIKLQELTTENAKLADRIRELEAGSASKGSDTSKLQQQVNDLLAEREVKQKELEALQAQYDELKAEAEAKIAELQSQLTTKKSTKKGE